MNINIMLSEDAKWLVIQGTRKTSEFVKVAEKIDLRQEDWDTFWKGLRGMMDYQGEEVKYNTILHGKEREMTQEEFDYAQEILGEAEEVSNCCSATIVNGICTDCLEHCDKLYILD